MDIKRGSQPHQARVRRLGKKVIFYGRIATVLGVQQPAGNKSKSHRISNAITRVRTFRPTRKQWVAGACAMVLVVAGVAGSSIYQSQRAAAAVAAAKVEAERKVKVDAAAQECYKKKTAEKQKMLDRVTYDQLYDGDSCLTSQ